MSRKATKGTKYTLTSVMEQSSAEGNAPQHAKGYIIQLLQTFFTKTNGFGVPVGSRMEITDISVVQKVDEPEEREGRVVCEVDVREDMLDVHGNIHGGCIAYLIDVCTVLPMIAYSQVAPSGWKGGTSLKIDMAFHSTAALGDRLRVVSRTLSVGSNFGFASCEIWNMTSHNLVASGKHMNMEPSKPKTKL
ncbi:hypothetical protein SCHPADRAFT_1002275 [Schizopora paradoxa]|uniref:Thioesterase domain-containing protein n=1 Tax=Schizopora paradoxa TaxID=27342 RepID=A0A0H2R471_9AGAM|nr:hypothetical protein SCHPADRAFT_1002275 [Schizopora paradoxa]